MNTSGAVSQRSEYTTMHRSRTSPRPFFNSLSALAQVAVRVVGADAYALFRKNSETRVFERQDASGDLLGDAALGERLQLLELNRSGADQAVIKYSLGFDGVLAFWFRDPAHAREARPQLDRIAGTVEAVWNAAHASERYAQLARDVADLETRLQDSKIADRARGLLTLHRHDQIEAIARHVEGILRETSTRRILQQISEDLKEEIEERRLSGRAKEILQTEQSMSEEEAHAHLRLASRQSRRRLKDVAREVIERHSREDIVPD
jgi:AmiR/NasT family two-component response regulator